MSRRKITVALDSEVVTALEALAASRRRSVGALIEDSLRAFLAGNALDMARADVRALMAAVGERGELADDHAMALAVDEVHAARASRRSG